MDTSRIQPLCIAAPRTELPLASSYPLSPYLTVPFGQATFNAEGTEALGRFFSRRIHWPGGASGVTIGRGYDMGGRTPSQVERELTQAGMQLEDAQWLANAAGLRGTAARTFFERERASSPLLPLQVQQSLFVGVTTPETIADIERIFAKEDTVARYGAVSWDALPKPVQEIVFDLRYRGDYTPRTREFIQPLLVSHDWEGLYGVMTDTDRWRDLNVPQGRIDARAEMAEALRTVDE